MNLIIIRNHLYLKFTFAFIKIACVLLIFNSCTTDPRDEIKDEIKIALRNDNEVDEEEWNRFTTYINTNNLEFSDLIGEDFKIKNSELNNFILEVARNRRNIEDPEIFNPLENENFNNENTKIKVFIENSGSMDGYVEGITEFEAALVDLLVQIQNEYDNENLNINFINSKIYPSQIVEIKDFSEKLEPGKPPYKVGNTTESKLNEIFALILDSTNQDNISILISDCIYSLEKDKDTEGALIFQKGLSKSAFAKKSKQFNVSTFILKMNSKFKGNYYDKNNGKTYLNKDFRPYYIWIIGEQKSIENFSKKIDIKSLEGYKNSYYLSNNSNIKTPFHTILQKTNIIGKFKPAEKGKKEITSINDLEYDNKKIQFALAIDLSNIKVEESYLIDKNNYKVNDGFTVESVDKVDINNMENYDFTKISTTKATHYVTISLNQDYAIQDLDLELMNKIPKWVAESNSDDDQDIKNQLDKTFGLTYLIGGVSEAFTMVNPKNTSYFKLKITIKK